MSDKKETTKEVKPSLEKKVVKTSFEGKYTKAIGRRKTSVAQVRAYEKGEGNIAVNSLPILGYFHENKAAIVTQPLKLTGRLKDLDISIIVRGGGVNAQAEACRHGVARALLAMDEELRPSLKAKGWLTRDSRKVERKKPGLKKARKAPQWSKR